MRYQVEENCLTIYLPREVDHHNADEIRKEADAVISRNHIRYVILTLTGQILWIVQELESLWGGIRPSV